MSWFQNLAPRERLLISIAATIFAFLMAWLLIWRPVMNYRDNAAAAEQVAARDLQIVTAGLPAISSVSIGAQRPFDRNALLTTAAESGLSISRVQPETDGALKIWFNDARAEILYSFISRLSSSYAVEISDVQISRAGNGLVAAQILFRPSGG